MQVDVFQHWGAKHHNNQGMISVDQIFYLSKRNNWAYSCPFEVVSSISFKESWIEGNCTLVETLGDVSPLLQEDSLWGQARL